MNLPAGVRLPSGTCFKSILAIILCLFFSPAISLAQTVDLAIQGASIAPPSVAAGNAVSATGSIYNLGNSPAASSNIGFYLSVDNIFDPADNLIGFSSAGTLNSGASSYRNVSLTIPGATTPGSYYILYVADYLNGVSENNENNNVSSVSIAVVPPSIDFTISYANLYLSSVAAGGSVGTDGSLYNQGNATATSSHVGYYLSTNNTLDEQDVFIGSNSGSSLSAGNYRSLYATLSIPVNTAPGSYYIIFAADYLNGVSESNETNNTLARPLTVAAPFVDLIVQSPYLYYSPAVAGASVSTESRIYNQGNVMASSSNLGYYLSTNNTWDEQDVFIGSSSGSTITANNYSYRSGNVTIPANTSPGSYYIIFAADYLNAVGESNETNNATAAPFTVISPSIDLTLNSLSISPSASAGNPINVNVNVYNQGNTSAASSNLGFYLSANTSLDASDVLIGFQNGSSLSSSGSAYRSASLTIPAATTPGNYYLIAAADYLNSVSESNENNNTVQAAISITAQGTTFITPQSGTVSFTTCTGKVYDNGGTSNYSNSASGIITLNPATAGSKIRLIFSFLSVESCCDRLNIYDGTSTSAPLIGSYTSNPGTVYATTSSGSLTLQFYTDGSVTDSGFEADIACVTTVPLPDLSVLSPTATPASLAAGTSMSVSASVSNNSTRNASSSTLGYYLSANNTFEATDVYLGNSSGSSLAAGASSYRSGTLTIPANTTPGAYYILYVADYLAGLSEENEANNVASVAINVMAPTIDLLLLSAFTSASTIASGTTFTTSGFIANQGSTPSPSSGVGYYLSANNTWEPTDVLLGNSYGGTLTGGNSAQQNATLNLPATTTAGNYYVLFVADYTSAVTETNETNNTRSVPITVTSPNYVDLALQSPTLASTTLLAGNSVAASVTISNSGNTSLPAHRSTVGFYLSSNNTFEASDLLLGTDTVATAFAAGTTALASDNLAIPAGTTPGSYYILFVADYGLAYAESNKTNNLSTLAVTIANPAIDLLVQNHLATPARLSPGAEITTTAAIRNQGTVSAPTSTIGYYLSADGTLDAGDLLLDFYAGSTLAAGTSSASQTVSFQLPASTAPGAYMLLFAADHNNHISETNETNNVSSYAIEVVAALPNLTFNASAVSAGSVVSGSLVSVTDSLQNTGTAPAASSPVSYFLSSNTTWDPADVLLLATSGGQLPNRAHGGAYQAATLTIPANTTPGAYYILFVADPDNQVVESNETDNRASQAIAITAPNVDLIVQNQSLSPAVAAAGNSIAVAASISNQGTTPAAGSSIAYYLSANTSLESGDVLLAVSAGSNLAAGSSAYRQTNITIPAATASGNYYILFAGDHAGDVSETDETNNVAFQALTVSASSTVDLVVQAPSGFPASVTAGNTVSVSSFVYNQGLAAASASTVGYYLSTNNSHDAADVLLGFSAGASLAAGGSASKSETLTIPAGTHAGSYFLLFVADHAQAVAESNETNNTGALALSVSAPAFADFSIQAPALNPAALLAGNPVTVSATLRNQGTAAAATSTLGYYLSADNALDAGDLLLDFSPGSALAAGASAPKTATLTIPSATMAGNYFLLFAADHAQQVAESSETNNVAAVALAVIAPTVDLLVQSPTATPAAVLPGNTLQVSAAIANQGTVAATSSNIGYYLSANNTFESSDLLLGSSAGGSLAATGAATRSAELTIPANTAAGNYFILFVADQAQAIAESDETNNTSALALAVIAPAIDLVLQSPGASVASLVAGNNLSVSATIQNSGTAPAPASVVHYYLSANATYESSDIALGSATGGTLAAGGSAPKTATLTIPANTATGNFYLLFVADQANAVTESDETNNVASVALAVTAPNIDLVVQNSTLSATTAVSGTTLTASTTVANTGNVAASASTVGYYLSANNTLESADILLGNSAGGTLAAGGAAAKTATLTIPANTAAGAYYILFAADHAAGLTETNETNNVAAIGLTVTSPSGPDLTATIPMTPTPVHPYVKGQTYTFTSTVRNQGNGASFSSSVGFYISTDNTLDAGDIFLNGATGAGLPVTGTTSVNLSASVTIPTNLAAGSTYRLLAVADYLNGVAEINEGNNVAASATVTIAAASVDVAVQPPTASPTSVSPSSAVSVTANLVNNGNTAATTNIGYYLSSNTTLEATDGFLTSLTGISLTAGGTTTRTASVTIPNGTTPGNYYLLAVADYTAALTESNETNNVGSLAITVTAPSVDLLIQSPTLPAQTENAGRAIALSCSIANLGNTTASTSNIGYYLSANNIFDASDVLLGTTPGGTLAAGASANKTLTPTIPLNTAPGNYFVLFVADNSGLVAESNEANNTSSLALTVTNLPDLILTAYSLPLTTVTAGGNLSFAADIRNVGTFPASSSTIGYYLSANNTYETSDLLLSNSVGNALAPNAVANKIGSLAIPVNTPAGNYYIIFVADPTQVVVESDEANNIQSVAISVFPALLPDLSLELSSPPAQTAVAGSSVNFQLRIQNRGAGASPGSTHGFFLSSDATFDPADQLLTNFFINTLAVNAASTTNRAAVIPAGTPSGNYYLLFVSDYHQSITESNESNNMASSPLTVSEPLPVPPAPDLVFTYTSMATNVAKAGDTLTFNVTASNIGTVAAAASTIGYYLSQNSSIDPSDTFLGQIQVNSLEPGTASVHAGNNLLIPTTVSPGSYYLLLKADYDDRIAEAFETNNNRIVPITITGPGTDLRFSSWSYSLNAGPAGSTTTATGTVINYGTSPATGSKVNFYFSSNTSFEPTDVLLGSTDPDTLAGNQRAAYTKPLTIPAGTVPGVYYIVAIVDPENTVAETQEGNNISVSTFIVGEIDLMISAGSPAFVRNLTTNTLFQPGLVTVNAGNRIEASLLVSNAGTVPVSFARLTCFLSQDSVYNTGDVLISNSYIQNLAANSGNINQYPLMTIPPSTRTGAYYVFFVSDPNNEIAETDETNNRLFLPIQVTGLPLPDLAVQAPAVNLAKAVAGASLRLSARLANTGTVDAGTSSLRYYLSADASLDSTDVALGTAAAGALTAGDTLSYSANVTLPANIATGSYHLLFVADADSTVMEENEANNFQSLAFQVGVAGVDLIVRSQTSVPSLVAGAGTPIIAKIYNQGVETAASSKIGVFLSADNRLDSSDVLLDAESGEELTGLTEAGRDLGFTIPLTTAPGNYFLLYQVDHLDEVRESDETNNLQAAALTVTAPPLPDLALKDLALGAATIARGSTLAATATLSNTGTVATGAGKVQYYLSVNSTFETGDVLLGESEVPALEAGATAPLSVSLTIPAATATGDYFILVVADATGLDAEKDEANNVAAVALAVSVANGIQDLEDTYAVKIGPNPASEKVYIAIDNLETGARSAEVTLHDLTGRKVFTAHRPVSNRALRTQVDVGHLSQGTYLLHIRIGGQLAVRRIVVERK